mmetsp:Transcript_523/g.2150  ORF Transcript_523/g.2150 Transcript_523/m.2150 type:complete len:327 (+) Transcript_523:108-1088(+)
MPTIYTPRLTIDHPSASRPLYSAPAPHPARRLAVEAGEVGEAAPDDDRDEDLLVEEIPYRHLQPERLEDHVGDPIRESEGHRERAHHQREGAEEPLVVVLGRRVAIDVCGGPGVHVHQLHEHAEGVEDGGVDDGLDRANGARGEPHEGDGGDGDGDVHLLVLERRFRRYRRPGSEERRREIVLASRLGHPGHVTAEPGGEGRLNDLLVRVLHLLELLGLGLVEQLLAVDHLGELVPRCALLDPEHLVRVLGHAAGVGGGGVARHEGIAAARGGERDASDALGNGLGDAGGGAATGGADRCPNPEGGSDGGDGEGGHVRLFRGDATS